MCIVWGSAQENSQEVNKVYIFEIHDEIDPAATRITENAITKAAEQDADYILLDLNTYGGLVTDADNIRTAILESEIPFVVFIRNNAASAGALISIACDSIYMKTGSTIGAAAVVNADGSYAEEKYQSYMRTKMIATAEATGRDTLIAEGMVNANVEIDGVSEKGEIITLSVNEAVRLNFCNGKAESIDEVIEQLNIGDAPQLIYHEVSLVEKIISLLVKPYFSGILLMIMIGGIYYELKTPGVGFPLAASLIAALLYFAPHYLEGFAAYWEIILFGIGIVLILLEVFVIPGFGVAGILGIASVVFSLAFALVKNINGFDFSFVPSDTIAMSFLMVATIMVFGVLLLLFTSTNLMKTKAFKRLALQTEQHKEEGFIISASAEKNFIGQEGIVVMDLRPAGKIEINEVMHDAQSDSEYISKGIKVKVVAQQGAYLIVNEIKA